MKPNFSKKYCSKWLVNFLGLPFLLINVPSYAATFTTYSQAGIIVNNFNQVPEDISLNLEVKATTIAEVASLQSLIGINSGFMVEPSSALAYSNILGNTVGTGINYQQDINLSTILMGRFLIPSNSFLRFDFNGLISLSNFTDNLSLNPVSTSAKIKFFLQDLTNQKTFDILQLTGALNTNSQEGFNKDLLSLYTSRNTKLDNRIDFLSLEDNQESIQTFFAGSHAQYFEKETELNLVMVTQSCNSARDTVNVCVRVPEPSNNLALFMGAFGVIGMSMGKIIKKVQKKVQFMDSNDKNSEIT